MQWNFFQKDHFKKSAEVTGDLIRKISDKITCALKSSKQIHSQNNLDETDITKERYVALQKKGNTLLMN